jgi:hypothetical protein
MKTIPAAVALVIGAFLLTPIERAEAREPFMGGYNGSCERRVEKAKPKKRKNKARANVVQDGPTNYDMRATVTATGGGEKLVIVLDLDAANNGTLTINGTVVAGPGARDRSPRAKLLRFRLSGKGTATFVGPLRQTLVFSGKSDGIPFTAKGVLDLDNSGGLILELDVKFSKASKIGRSASFDFRGARS